MGWTLGLSRGSKRVRKGSSEVDTIIYASLTKFYNLERKNFLYVFSPKPANFPENKLTNVIFFRFFVIETSTYQMNRNGNLKIICFSLSCYCKIPLAIWIYLTPIRWNTYYSAIYELHFSFFWASFLFFFWQMGFINM